MRPRDLPKLRDQTVRHLDNPTAPIRSSTSTDHQAGLDTAARHLRAADLYWVAPDMTALAMSSGAQLAAARWATTDRPAPCGLLAWDGGISHTLAAQPRVEIPIEAVTWGPGPGGLLVWTWISRRRLDTEIDHQHQQAGKRRDFELVTEQIPPLIPIAATTLPIGAEPTPFAEVATTPGLSLAVVQALAAAWLLMQQPQLVEHSREHADRAVRAAYARAQRPDPEVTVIDLRRQYVPDGADPAGEPTGRRYRHRWVVSGHWRQQPHGPDRAQRRQQWIPSHVKGPDGAPLLATERVNVWRR